jgi:hypothetical protein
MSGRADSSINRGVYLEAVTTNTSNAHDLAFATSASGNAPTERMRIDSAGKLLIGISSALSSATAASPTLQNASTVASSGGLLIQNATANNGAAGIYSTKTRSGTIGDYSTSVINGDFLMFIDGEGSDGVSALKRAGSITINASETFSPTSSAGYITFNTTPSGSTSTSERMRITSDGNVGIGLTSPVSRLHSLGPSTVDYATILGSTGDLAASSPQSVIKIQNSSNTNGTYAGIVLTANNAIGNNNNVYIATFSSSTVSTGTLVFGRRTGAATSAESMRIDTSGNLLVGKTSATANGGDIQVSKGITFPATQSAQSDANTLDDYEEGTWTATLTGSTTSPSTPVTASGLYTKIGRLVYVSATFTGVNTTGASGDMSVTGLPFSVINNQQARAYSIAQCNSIDFAAGTSYVVARANSGTTTVGFFDVGDNIAALGTKIPSVSNVYVGFSVCYQTT